MNDENVLKVVTPRDELVRFSYAHVFEPTSMEEGQKPKYSVSILIPKENKKTLAMIQKAFEAAKIQGKEIWGGKIPTSFKHQLLRDGDEDRPDDPVYQGHYYVNAKSISKPTVINTEGAKLTTDEEFYSGCYGCVSFNVYPYVTGSKGVAAGLGNILKVKDGEKLSGKSSAYDDFGVEHDDLF